jgi:hypothetical protein
MHPVCINQEHALKPSTKRFRKTVQIVEPLTELKPPIHQGRGHVILCDLTPYQKG